MGVDLTKNKKNMEKSEEAQDKASTVTQQGTISEVQDKTPVVEVKKAPVAREKRVINPTDLIEVYNNSGGTLVFNSRRSQNTWVWTEHGGMELMEFQELVSMRASQRRFFEEQWVKILDEDVVNQLRVGHFYKEVINDDDIDNILLHGNASELETVLGKMKMNDKSRLLSKAREYVESGELTDYHILDVLEERFGAVLR